MVRFALVTLVYNKERFLKKCIDSALRQTCKDFVYFIVDDGSTDSSRKIINKYKSAYGNIVFYKFDKSEGQMPRYNFVLRKINKKYPNIDYMGHLDGDDMLMPNAIDDSIKFFDRVKKSDSSIGHVSSYFSIIDPSDKIMHKVGRSFPDLKDRKKWMAAQCKNNFFGHFRTMRIDCLNAIGGFDERFKYATDYNMACRMLNKFNVSINQKVLYLWRRHGNQIEKSVGKEQTECWKRMKAYYSKKWGV